MNVTVVGAGIVGTAIAYELARRGVRVHVVDPRPPGQGATRASAGILAPYIEGHVGSLRRLGIRSLALYQDFIQRLSADAGSEIEYSRCGTLQLAATDADAAQLQALAGELAESRVVHRVFVDAEVREVEPNVSPSMRSALLIPSHGYVTAASLMQALIAACTNLGVSFETAAVTQVGNAAAGACVHTMSGRMESDAAIIAAGSWSPTIPIRAGMATSGVRPERPPVRPIRGQLVRLETEGPVASHVVWGPGCYLVPLRDGSVLVGATVENAGFDERPTAAGVRGLLDAAVSCFPALENAVFGGVRVGLRPATDDELPILGWSSSLPRVLYATGHFRNGILLAPLSASLVSDLIVDGQEGPGMEMMRPSRLGL